MAKGWQATYEPQHQRSDLQPYGLFLQGEFLVFFRNAPEREKKGRREKGRGYPRTETQKYKLKLPCSICKPNAEPQPDCGWASRTGVHHRDLGGPDLTQLCLPRSLVQHRFRLEGWWGSVAVVCRSALTTIRKPFSLGAGLERLHLVLYYCNALYVGLLWFGSSSCCRMLQPHC